MEAIGLKHQKNSNMFCFPLIPPRLMDARALPFLYILLTSLCLHAQIFSGMEITESQLADFVKPIRQLQPGIDTSDDIVGLIGAPHGKSDNGHSEVWNYGFLVTSDKEAAETARLEKEIAQLELQCSSLRDQFFDPSMSVAENNRINSAIDKIEDRLEPLKSRRREISFEVNPMQVNCDIVLDVNGRILSIEVSKFSEQGRKLVYSKSAAGNSNADIVEPNSTIDSKSEPESQASSEPPKSPKLGQIYFNITDKCFCGWNGTSWDRLSANQ